MIKIILNLAAISLPALALYLFMLLIKRSDKWKKEGKNKALVKAIESPKVSIIIYITTFLGVVIWCAYDGKIFEPLDMILIFMMSLPLLLIVVLKFIAAID